MIYGGTAYDPRNWFWRVAEDGRVYSSATRAFVSDFSPDRVTEIPTLAALERVLSEYPDHLPPGLASASNHLKEKIRAEADRRIQVAIGARNLAHSQEAQVTGTATAAAIINKRLLGQTISPEDQWVEATYAFLFEYIRAVKAAQVVLETSLPSDFTDNRHWPA